VRIRPIIPTICCPTEIEHVPEAPEVLRFSDKRLKSEQNMNELFISTKNVKKNCRNNAKYKLTPAFIRPKNLRYPS